MLPVCRAFFQEGLETFDGVASRHELRQVELFELGELFGNPRDQIGARGPHRQAQRGSALRQEVLFEVGECRALGIVRDLVEQSERVGVMGIDAAPREQEILCMGAAYALR